MLQTNSEVLKMRNYIKNKMKDRLTYCHEWKNSVDIYLAVKKLQKKLMKNTINQSLYLS